MFRPIFAVATVVFLLAVALPCPVVAQSKQQQLQLEITSPAFKEGEMIPKLYTCKGKDGSPPLKIAPVVKESKSLVLIMDDPDAPSGDFVHWVIWNMSPKTSIIKNSIAPEGAMEGYTSLNKPGFVAPCPPSGIHRYNFKLYALDAVLSIPKFSNKADLTRAMDKHIIGSAEIIGLYGK